MNLERLSVDGELIELRVRQRGSERGCKKHVEANLLKRQLSYLPKSGFAFFYKPYRSARGEAFGGEPETWLYRFRFALHAQH